MSSLLLRVVSARNLVNINRYKRRRADPGRRRYCGRQRILLHAARDRKQVSKDDIPFAVSLLRKKLHSAIFSLRNTVPLESSSSSAAVHCSVPVVSGFNLRSVDPVSDPGGPKWPTKKGRKSKEMSCFEVMDVLFWALEASPYSQPPSCYLI